MLPKMWGGIVPFQALTKFRIGEGGWQLVGPTRVPRTPDPALTDLDLLLDPGRPGNGFGAKRYNLGGESFSYYEKVLPPGACSFIAPNILQIICTLDFAEYNTDQPPAPGGASGLVYDSGGPYGSPELWKSVSTMRPTT